MPLSERINGMFWLNYIFSILIVVSIILVFCRAILATRNVVERSYGMLKRRFHILQSGMQLRRVELIQKVISVCCILHNLCIDMGDINVEDLPAPVNVREHDDGDELAPLPILPPVQPVHPRRRIVRDEIVAVFEERLVARLLPQ